MEKRKWGYGIISLVFLFLFFWSLLMAIKNIETYNLPLAALILVILIALAKFSCPWAKRKK